MYISKKKHIICTSWAACEWSIAPAGCKACRALSQRWARGHSTLGTEEPQSSWGCRSSTGEACASGSGRTSGTTQRK